MASCAGSRFLETNHEFVQSNECEDAACLGERLAQAKSDRDEARALVRRFYDAREWMLDIPKARAPYADATGIMSAWEPIADDVPPTPEPSA